MGMKSFMVTTVPLARKLYRREHFHYVAEKKAEDLGPGEQAEWKFAGV